MRIPSLRAKIVKALPPPGRWILGVTLLGCTAGIITLGALGSEVPTGRTIALVMVGAGLLLPPGWSVPLLLVGAHSANLLTAHAIGALSPVDAMVLAVLVRVVLTRFKACLALLRMPPVIGAACFIVSGALATVSSPEHAAITAFLRVSAYLALGVSLIAALNTDERRRILIAIVGVAIGDAVGALAGVTGQATGTVVGGRYLGTLGDPAQFGIPVAVALLVVAWFPWHALTGARRGLLSRQVALVVGQVGVARVTFQGAVRVGLVGLLMVALIGSRTRAAYVAAFSGGAGLLALLAARWGVSPRIRFSMGVLTGAAIVGIAGAFALGAKELGFDPVSARVRIESLRAAGEYLVAHPLRPTGLGNLPGPFPAYNTWLALTVALTPVAALGLAVFIGGGLVRAFRLPGPEWFAAMLAFLAPTMTENLVFAGSSMTLSWFILTGLVLGYGRGRDELARRDHGAP